MAQLKLTSQMDARNAVLCCSDSEMRDMIPEALALAADFGENGQAFRSYLDSCRSVATLF